MIEEQELGMFVMPGYKVQDCDDLDNIIISKNQFQLIQSSIIAVKAGYLYSKKLKNNKTVYWIQSGVVSYTPKKGDHVIGKVKYKNHQFYTVDINSHIDATLDALQFQGASKKNKPNLQIGSLIYAKIIEEYTYLRPKLSCKGIKNKKEWTTGQSEYGELEGGWVVKKCGPWKEILEEMGCYTKVQAAIGGNHLIWTKTTSISPLIIINSLINSPPSNIPQTLKTLVHLLQ